MYYLSRQPQTNDLDVWETDQDADTILNHVELLYKGRPSGYYSTKPMLDSILIKPMTELHGTTTTIAHLRKFLIAEAEDRDTLLAYAVVAML